MSGARQLLGKKLKFARENVARLNSTTLAEKAGTSRSWIDNVEKGVQNFQINEYEKAILACGLTFEDLFKEPSGRTPHPDLFWMVKAIVDSGNERAIDALRYTLLRFTSEPRPESQDSEHDATHTGDLSVDKKKPKRAG
jgi:transcriptional regulator with XRE-family HTH domain